MKNTYTLAQKKPVLWLTMTAVLLAMNVALSSFSIPVPGGHLYLNDVVICTASILLDPFAAFVVGGIGAFLGDFFFYPTPMFVSLVTHGLQAVVISLCAHHLFQKKPMIGAGIGVLLGAIIMVVGYFFYASLILGKGLAAAASIPGNIVQGIAGVTIGMALAMVLQKTKSSVIRGFNMQQ